MARYALAHLQPGSSIINTGPITGLEGSPALLDYSATKGAIHASTKSLARNVVGRGIRVNCVAPGPVWTPLNPAERSDEDIEDFGAGTPLGRPAQPEEIAPAYVFFASNADSGYISGEVLPILGRNRRRLNPCAPDCLDGLRRARQAAFERIAEALAGVGGNFDYFDGAHLQLPVRTSRSVCIDRNAVRSLPGRGRQGLPIAVATTSNTTSMSSATRSNPPTALNGVRPKSA